MFKKIGIVFVLLCYSIAAIAQTGRIDSVVMAEMKQQSIPGLSLGIVKNGKVIVSKGYGWANIEDSIPATENTVYKTGSLSKQFIATCILVLAKHGKLNLSDHIDKYFKDAPAEWGQITIRNLLTHTSGIERESPIFNWMKRQSDSELIRSVYKDKLRFPAGSKWEYSNMGYTVLADIIRKVSGQSFEDYMNHFFLSIGLKQTTTTTKSKSIDRARGYDRYDEKSGEISEAVDFVALRPSGAFSSSISDMIKWDAIQKGNKLLSPQDWGPMWEDTVRMPRSANGSVAYYGYGWFVREYMGHRLVHHGGNTRGFTSEYWKLIDDNTSIILLANANDVNLTKIAGKIAAILNPDFKTIQPVIANIDRYPGVYYNKQLAMSITITREGNNLIAQASGQQSFPLQYIEKDKFKFDEAGIEMYFNTDKNELTLKQSGETDIFIKE